MGKTLVLVDYHNLMFRSFFALGRTRLTTQDGTPIGALYGGIRYLQMILRQVEPDYLAFVGDAPGEVFRSTTYEDYKAHREKTPDDLTPQFERMQEYIETLGVPYLECPGYEADDVMASLAARLAGKDLEIILLSGDKDLLQVVTDAVHVLAAKPKRDSVLYTPKQVKAEYGVMPAQFIDYQALVGDSADNVPGVRGIGGVNAAKLITRFGDLDGIYENLAELSKRQRGQLTDGRADADLSKSLVALKTDVAVSFDLEKARFDPRLLHSDALRAFFQSYGFQSLINEMDPGGETPVHSEAHRLERVGDVSDLPRVVSGKAGFVLCELDARRKLHTLTVRVADKTFYAEAESLKDSQRSAVLKLLFQDMWITHGVSELLWAFPELASRVSEGAIEDTQLLDYIQDAQRAKHGLSEVVRVQLGRDDVVTPEECVLHLGLLYQALVERLSQDEIKLYESIERPLAALLFKMEKTGVYVDAAALAAYDRELSSILDSLQNEIHAFAGEDFNIQSPAQFGVVLFEKLQIQGRRRVRKTKTGYGTSEQDLEPYLEHPLVSKVLRYRQLAKLRNTYLGPLQTMQNPETGRIHVYFRQTVAATGRLSCDHPNLQNIPMRRAEGKAIRAAFRAQKPGWVLLSADYSQIELRLLAHYTKAKSLIEGFQKDLDIHRLTAAAVGGCSEDEVTDAMRSRAKAINFGVIYGMGKRRLAQQTKMSLAEAEAFMLRYFETYPEVADFRDELIHLAETRGYSQTLLGRRRRIEGLKGNSYLASHARNMAVNAPLQGTAADIIKIAMLRVEASLRRDRLQAQLILQVHDELVLELPSEEEHVVTKIVKSEMENAYPLAVPLKVSLAVGPNWLSV